MEALEWSGVLDNVQTTYQTVSSHITWTNVATYGGLIFASWGLYKALVEPFLSPLRKLPGTKFNPVLGNMRDLVKGEAMEATIKIMKDHGVLCRYYFLFGRERLLIADPDILKHVLVTNCKNYVKPKTRLTLMRMILGNGLVLSEGATHASHKRLLSPSFNNNSIKKMMPVFVKRGRKLVDHWLKKISSVSPGELVKINAHEDFTCTTLDIVGELGFGYDFNSLEVEDPEINQAFQGILTGASVSWLMALPFSHRLPLKSVQNFKRNVGLMHKTVQDVIRHKKDLLVKGEDREKVAGDVLGQMLLAQDEEGIGLSDKELQDQVMTLMLAGHETTAVTLSWCSLLLAQNPDIQDKAREEVLRILPSNPDDITWDHLEQLTYCKCVIKETLRLYPAVPMTLRQSLGDDYLGTKDSQKYYIPAGTISLLAIGPMMRRSDLFESPNEFIPERFLDPKVDDGLYSFLPFLIGHRMCLGFKFALIEIRVVLAQVLQNMVLQPVPGIHFKRQSRITMRPNPSLTLLVKKAQDDKPIC